MSSPLVRAAALACASVSVVATAASQSKPGGDPGIKPGHVPAPLPPAASARSVYALPPGASATTTSHASPNVPLAIADLATQSSTLAVSGAGTFLWDVDLVVDIEHTWCSDLDLTLAAPSGKIVTITTDQGLDKDDVFAGTRFDDSSANAITKFAFVNGAAAADLTAEGCFASLIGEDPNGTWTLAITDDAGGDVGTLQAWSLDVTTLAAPPPSPSTPATYASSPNLAIVDLATAIDTIQVAGQGNHVAEVRVYTEIEHTWPADVDLALESPAGTRVQLTNLNGGGAVDAFDGTDWRDGARNGLADLPASSYAYVAGVPAGELAPDAAFSRLFGEGANGAWKLVVYDNAPGDAGRLAHWELELRTYAGGGPPPVPYCTAGTTSSGCSASIAASANPSVSLATPCTFSVSSVEGQRTGLLFYGVSGRASFPWCTSGGTSYLCLIAPTQRLGSSSSGGAAGQCDGALAADWNAFQLAHPTALGNPFATGQLVQVQAWFRDPPSCKTTSLSNAVEVTCQP
jgi:subtilisin-like proprotein convertase family protein